MRIAFIFNCRVGAIMQKSVSFPGQNQSLVGKLFFPDDCREGDKLPSAAVPGAWKTVKEPMPAIYVAELAERGYLALVLDFQGGSNPATASGFWKMQNENRRHQRGNQPSGHSS